MSGFGYNVQKVENPTAFSAHFKNAQLKGGVFYAGSVSLDYLASLVDENPGALIVVRNWPDADQHTDMTPRQWIDRFKPQSKGNRLIIGASNESGWDSAFVSWTLELCKLAVQENMRICVLNIASGHNLTPEWEQAHDILQLAVDHPDIIYIGLHEYAGGVITSGFVGGNPNGTVTENGKMQVFPGLLDYTNCNNWPKSNAEVNQLTKWHCGRFMFLQKYCEDKFGKWPSVILTEHGFDFLSDIGVWLNSLPRSASSINGWRTLTEFWKQIFPDLTAEEALWMQLKWANENIYANSCVKMQAIYTYGPNPDWTPYRVDGAIETNMENYVATPVSTFTVVPDGKDYTVTIPNNASLNFRDMPNVTASQVIGKVITGNRVTIVSRYLQLRNNWCKINFNGQDGFISCLTDANGNDTVKFVEVVPPVVIPPPPQETNWTALKADIDTAISKLQSIKLLLPN